MQMKQEEKQVFADFQKYANVVEPWALIDSILICNTFYGTEQNVGGWFTNWVGFSGRETHSFYKTRTDGIAGAMYCNLQSSDSMDFAFICHSIGITFMGIPGVDTTHISSEGETVNWPDPEISHWFTSILPQHCAIQLKIQQDIRAEANCMMMPPGYGALGAGTSFEHTNSVAPAHGDIPYISHPVTQGVPLLSNRYPLPVPIGIPRTASIEGILHVSDYARWLLGGVGGPGYVIINSDDGLPAYGFWPARYIVQMSLIGERLVQQRAQYHR